MIFNIGTDIVMINRVEEKIIEKILSEKEKKLYDSFKSVNRRKEFAAGRFSAKESIVKCLDKKIIFNKITILNDSSGKPYLDEDTLDYLNKNYGNLRIHLSISHEKEYALSFVVVEK